jgi:hypothetical protein
LKHFIFLHHHRLQHQYHYEFGCLTCSGLKYSLIIE